LQVLLLRSCKKNLILCHGNDANPLDIHELHTIGSLRCSSRWSGKLLLQELLQLLLCGGLCRHSLLPWRRGNGAGLHLLLCLLCLCWVRPGVVAALELLTPWWHPPRHVRHQATLLCSSLCKCSLRLNSSKLLLLLLVHARLLGLLRHGAVTLPCCCCWRCCCCG
jgi:hypothetical protein